MSDKTIAITDADFEANVKNSSTPVLVDFWAPWCGPCVAIGPVLDTIADEYQGKVTIAKMNVDENANVPSQYGVRSIPCLIMFKGGEVVDTIVGAVPKTKIVEAIEKTL